MLRIDGKGSKPSNGNKLKGKEYIALLCSGKLETYTYECDFNGIADVDNLVYELNGKDMFWWMNGLDESMLKTGFKSFITLESEDIARRYYLCKKLKKLPDSVYTILNRYFDLFYSKEKSNSDFDASSYDDNLGCASLEVNISESLDDENALSIDSNITYGEGMYDEGNPVSFSKEDFYAKNISPEYECFTDMVNSVLKEFKGITVDKLSLFMASNLAVDLKSEFNKDAFSYFIGISRVYKKNWCVPENPNPATEDTYEVCIMVVPTYSSCVVKRKDYYKSLLGYINSSDCDVDWEEINDKNGEVIGYKNKFYNVMKDDTVDSLVQKDVNTMKKLSKKR